MTNRRPDPADVLRDDTAVAASLRAALAETVRRHRLYGVPLVVWRDGRVQEVAPETVDGSAASEPPAAR